MIKKFIERPVLSTVVSIILLLLGGLSLYTLPITLFPDIAPPSVQVSAFYPGANAEVVARSVATPVEEAINGVENMTYMTSNSNNDGSIILKALDLDQNRYSFSHTRVYNISSGPHTFYAVGEITGGNGSKTGDLFGALTVKYIPFSSTPVTDVERDKIEFDLYPNPTRDEVHISLRNIIDPKNKIKLLDVNGCLLKEYPYTTELEFKIDLSGLPANQYWVQIGDQVKLLVKM